tara:strand:+ start:89 stop:472 length:384 start_codon:yes stop_codon:yes gene_type:complete
VIQDPNVKDLTFEELVEYRRAKGHEEYGVELSIGVIVDRAYYKDISWECIEELADAIVYLEFEDQKLRDRSNRLDSRTINSLMKSINTIANSLYGYRRRIKNKYPEILEDTLEDEIRSGNIREIRSL